MDSPKLLPVKDQTAKCSAKDFFDAYIVLSIKEMQFTSVEDELTWTYPEISFDIL